MEGRGSARQGDGMGQAHHVREFALERVEMRTERDDPVGIERVEEKPAFLRSHVRRREIRALARLSHGAAFPYRCPAVLVRPPGSSRWSPPANRPASAFVM